MFNKNPIPNTGDLKKHKCNWRHYLTPKVLIGFSSFGRTLPTNLQYKVYLVSSEKI